MKKLGRMFKNKWFWILGGFVLLLVFVGFKTIAAALGLSNGKYVEIAKKLNWAMVRVGTDENFIFNLLEPLSGFELVKVYNAFGTQPYGLSGGLGWFGNDLNLFEWFDKEFSPIWDRKDLEKLREIWSKSGMEITF